MNKSLLGCWLIAVLSVGCNCGAPPTVAKLLPEGERCEANERCETGLCDSLPETNRVCVRPCSTGCLAGEVCTQLTVGQFSCAPDLGGLCQACKFDSDCSYPSDRCIVVDNQNICGRDCGFDQKCPDKYRCMNAVGTDGRAKPQQCAPSTGTCKCTLGQGTPETCNGLDDDCDTRIDNGIDKDTDLNNCGGCNVVCEMPNATPRCATGTCRILACTAPFQNCDNVDQNGCETDLSTINDCGACDNTCAFANATPRCETAQCKFTCLAGFIDLNGLPADGCEYQCTPTSATTDLPNLGFTDANCDGIDGEWNNGIFVAPAAGGGSNSNPGTKALPLATINAGIAAAISQGKRDVYVASGTYPGQLTLTNVQGIIVAGGYSLPGWSRSLNNTTTVGPANPGLQIEGMDGGTVQFFTVQGANPATPGANAYGAWVKDSAVVRLEGLTVSAGVGANGASGISAAASSDGQPGQAGQQGSTHDPAWSIVCAVASSPPVAGTGGTSACGQAGGRGGNPGWEGNASSSGSAGLVGSGVTAGGLGTPGSQGNWSVPSQYNGANGAAGTDGSNGSGASGAGTLSAIGYLAALATPGIAGTSGLAGGGGGGGGGGCSKSLAGLFCACYSYGSAGGGGGAAGCGGAAGQAGQAGGASIGLYSWNSGVTLQASTVMTSSAGNGGSGGVGATGGLGALGASSSFDADAQGDASKGGKGGNGGNGGRGGHGGGGIGGSNFGIVSNSANPVNSTGVSFVRGQPGTGGTSMGAAGQSGPSSDVQSF